MTSDGTFGCALAYRCQCIVCVTIYKIKTDDILSVGIAKLQGRVRHTYSYKNINLLFLFCTYNTVSITLKRVSKRSSFRYAFQEHLLKILTLAVTHSELLLGDTDHCISRLFKFKTYNCSSIYQRYQPLYLPNILNFSSIMF
jgi:hypothetical protein